jgi:hypothetical protein
MGGAMKAKAKTKKPAAKKKPAAAKAKAKPKPVKKPAAAKKKPATPMAKKFGTRADLGAPVDGFFAKQPPALRPITLALRALIEDTVPGAVSSIKWGMPFYTLDGGMMCAIGAHRSHVNLILAGPPGSFEDPEGRLTGDGKTGKHLKLQSLDDLPQAAARAWIATAAKNASAAKTMKAK